MKFDIDEKGKLIRVRPSSVSEVVIDIPFGVTSIGEEAFLLCGNIEKVNIPSTVETIENKAFQRSKIKEIIIPSSVKNIEINAFGSCHYLERVEINANLNKIPQYCFANCIKLKEVILPPTIEEIEKLAFCGCNSLKRITLPASLKKMGASVFSNCRALKRIDLPDSVEYVERGIFEFCEKLSKVKISSSLENISEGMFSNCLKLQNIDLGPVTSIGKDAFKNCSSLNSISLPETVENIGEHAFLNCSNITSITFPKQIKEIAKGAFCNCLNLENIEIPSGIKEIKDDTFFNCHKLKNVILPKSIKIIGNSAFFCCSSLETLNMPQNLEQIGSNAFQNCLVLEKVNLADSLRKIEYAAFENCKKLTDIKIPQSVNKIGLSVFDGTPIERVEIGDFQQLFELGIKYVKGLNSAFFNYDNGSLILSKQIEDNFKGYKQLRKKWYIDSLGYYDLQRSTILSIIFGEQEQDLGRLEHILAWLPENIDKSNYKEIRENINNKKDFERLLKQIETKLLVQEGVINYMCFDLFKLSYSLGAFSQDKIQRQRACEFLMNILEKQLITMEDVHGSFESMQLKNFNQEWAEFVMNKQNLNTLINLEKKQTGYISRIYNTFKEIKEYGRSNRGNQHYRKVTIKMCEEYLSNVIFQNVDDANIDIAQTISKYTRNQESFEKAVEIREEYLELIQEGEIKEFIIEGINEVLNNLNDIANQNFTIEFLNKYDPLNFVLGKFCSCCAHLEGVGSGIMQASIIHPDCQNLIVKDSEGKIIAKSTLYINRKQGYGVFNNVEINNNITDNYTKQKIYQKYVEAVRKIAKAYNDKNPSKPLVQINVGMHLNDLEKQIRANAQKGDVLTAIDFSAYGSYKGDWQQEQYVIWKKDEKQR